jgi:hypothetical protein
MPCCPSVRITMLASQPKMPPTMMIMIQVIAFLLFVAPHFARGAFRHQDA